jgi:hypothetical protein
VVQRTMVTSSEASVATVNCQAVSERTSEPPAGAALALERKCPGGTPRCPPIAGLIDATVSSAGPGPDR